MIDNTTTSEDVVATYRHNRKVFQVTLTLSGDSIAVSSPSTKPVYTQVGDPTVEAIKINHNDMEEPSGYTGKKVGCSKCGKSKNVNPSPPLSEPETQSDEKRGVASMIRGAVGLAKSELGIGAASEEEVSDRRSICIGCDKQVLGVCSECGCYCAAKVKIAKERCPIGKWGD